MATNSGQNTNEMLLDSLIKGLKAAWKFVKLAIRILGILFIDKGMRFIVEQYDKYYHKTSPAKERNLQDKIEHLRNQVDGLRRDIDKEKTQNTKLSTKLENAENEATALKNELEKANTIATSQDQLISQLRNTLESLSDRLNEKENIIKTLQNEEEKQTESEKQTSPQTLKENIIYAEGDASSSGLRKTSLTRQPTSLYEIHTKPETPTIGNFYALTPDNVSLIIQNRNIALRACHVEYIEPEANAIETTTPGKAHKNGKDWIVLEPAIIKLIKY